MEPIFVWPFLENTICKHKVSVQTSNVLLYTSNEDLENGWLKNTTYNILKITWND